MKSSSLVFSFFKVSIFKFKLEASISFFLINFSISIITFLGSKFCPTSLLSLKIILLKAINSLNKLSLEASFPFLIIKFIYLITSSISKVLG